jgi:hypothetical protein
MLKKILLGLVAVIALLAIVIATRPAEYTVVRKTTIQAAPEIAFARVNDFHRWIEWSPWDKLDPAMKRTFEGASTGAGALYGWTGNDQVGEGRMTIEESKLNELVRIKLEFIKPFPATSTTTFTFAQAGAGTEVTWQMVGQNNFISKAFSLFMDMDKMIGADFERGLASMKEGSETEAKKVAEEKAQAAAKAAAEAAAAAQAAPPPAEGQPAQGTATAPAP